MYQKIVNVIDFIHSSLFHDIYSSESSEPWIIPYEPPYYFHWIPMKLKGSFIWNDVSDMLINDHLSADVPTTNYQLEKYEPVYKETVNFETTLSNELFIPPKTNKLSKYVSRLNTQFSNKVCQDILSIAHDIMLYNID